MLKRFLLLSLAALMCISVFASCNSSSDESSLSDGSVSDNSTDTSEKEEEEKMFPYWGFNDYETIENPGAPDEIKSYETLVEKNGADKYTFTCNTDAGKLTLTIERRPWGTYNLCKWFLTDKSGKTHMFVGGSTDLEYVHQVKTPKNTVVWSGGNHGNEALVSLEFYNAETGEKLDLDKGKVTVNRLHIIEKTKLLWIPDDNRDSIGDYDGVNVKTYTDDDVYAELTRKYTITGPQIKLNVDYKYVKDTYHSRNYSCMFPIDKRYGLWCEMYSKDGKILKTIETLKVGAADYSGPHNQGNEATRAVVYGYTEPKYQFDMRINTFKDTVNEFKDANYKTSFWDMNTSSNKLYFTRFDEGQSVLHENGKEVHTECLWLFKYNPDGKLPDDFEVEKPFEEIKPDGTLVSAGKSYTLSGLLGEGYGNYKALLTDGKYTNGLTYDSNWFTFFNSSELKPEELNTENGIGYIIVDLEKETDLSTLRAHICNGGTAGINAPAYAKAYISSDGKNFEAVGDLPINSDASAIYWSAVDAKGKSARYVKFEFKLNGLFCFLNEVEVYAE